MVEEVGELHPVASRELEWILREALGNVERHARAGKVTVRLRRLGGRAVLTVADDGAGFEVPDEVEELARGHHFGRDRDARARAAGGRGPQRRVGARGGLRAVGVDARRGARAGGGAARPRRRGRCADRYALPTRSVPGYTWR